MRAGGSGLVDSILAAHDDDDDDDEVRQVCKTPGDPCGCTSLHS